MNFEIKNIEDGNLNIIDLKDVCVNSYIKQLFKDNSHTVYVLNDKNFYGAITPKSILNFDTANVIDKNYHILKAENGLNNSEIANIALTNNVFNFPIFINGEIKKEYVITDRPISIFSMNKERWQILYQNNTKMSNYINSNLLKNFIVQTIGDNKIHKNHAQYQGIKTEDFIEANLDDNNYLDLDEILGNDDLYKQYATLYVNDLEKKQEAKDKETEKEEQNQIKDKNKAGV